MALALQQGFLCRSAERTGHGQVRQPGLCAQEMDGKQNPSLAEGKGPSGEK